MTLRIALFVYRFPAASETFVAQHAAALLEAGHVVDVYADEAGSADLASPAIRSGGLLERMHSPLPIRDAFRAAGMRMLRPARRWHAISSWMRAFRYGHEMAVTALRYAAAAGFETAEYDVIHAHFGPNGIKASAMRDAGWITGRLIVTFHGYDVSRYPREKGKHVYTPLFERADLVLPVTEHWKKRLIELGCDADRIRVHRMGIDPESFGHPKHDASSDAVELMTVGRLVEKKGIDYALRASARIAPLRSFRYTIVGDGPERERLESLIAELELTDRVRILGWRPPAETRALLGRADIAVVPSVTARDGDQEGLPVVLMEAMAAGLPVVSTRHTGIPELVDDGVEGFLLEERDVEGLTDRLMHLIEKPALRLEMGERARRRVEQQHDNRVLNEQLETLYHRLVAEGRA